MMRFLLELDYGKIKTDEADWYFCLKRKDYNFKGVLYEGRLIEKERIDREKGHKIPKVIFDEKLEDPRKE